MPKKDEKGKKEKDSESSTSQSSEPSVEDETNPLITDGSRKPTDGNRETRGPGQKKRPAENLGETSSGNILQPSHSKKDYTDEGVASPSKRSCLRKNPLLRGEAFDYGEDSNPTLYRPMGSLELKDESVGKEANEPQPPGPAEHVASTAELEQSPKTSHLTVPVHSSEVHPTSPKEKGLYGLFKEKSKMAQEKGKRFLDYFGKKLSPKHSPDKGSSSEKADLELKQKPRKFNPPKLNPAKSEASSSSSSPKSKRGDSSPDRSQPSTSSSDPNVEYRRAAKKSPHKIKSRAESSSASTSDDSRRVETLNVPSGGEGSRSPSRRSRSRSPLPACNCSARIHKGPHDAGCSRMVEILRRKNAHPYKNSTKPPGSTDDSSGTASDSNVEFYRATKSPSKSKKTVSPRVSTCDPSQPGTSRWLYVAPSDNSPNRSDDGARSPNRRSPGNSPNRSDDGARSPNRRSQGNSPNRSDDGARSPNRRSPSRSPSHARSYGRPSPS